MNTILKILLYIPFHRLEILGLTAFVITKTDVLQVEHYIDLTFKILSALSVAVGLILKIISQVREFKNNKTKKSK